MTHLLRAELRRLPRSGIMVIPTLGLAFGLIQTLIVWGTIQNITAPALIASNVMWLTSLAQFVAALTLVLMWSRELKARGGGTWWRPADPTKVGIIRIAVSSGIVLLTNIGLTLPGYLLSLLLPGYPLTHSWIALTLVFTLGSICLYPLYELIAARVNTALVLVVAVLWTVVGVLNAESAYWKFIPPAWPIRAALPILNTHANGELLSASDPIRQESSLLAIGLTVATLVVTFLYYLILARVALFHVYAGKKKRAFEKTHKPQAVGGFGHLNFSPPQRVPAAPIRANMATLRRTTIIPVSMCSLIGLVLIAFIWSKPNYLLGTTTLLLTPVLGIVSAIVGWTTSEAALRATWTCGLTPRTLISTRIVALLLPFNTLVVFATALSVMHGVDIPHAIRVLIAATALGAAILIGTMLLATRWSIGIAVAVNSLGLVTSLVLGAGELARHYWWVAPWSWAHTPTTLGWPQTLLVSGICAAACLIFLPLLIRTMNSRAGGELT